MRPRPARLLAVAGFALAAALAPRPASGQSDAVGEWRVLPSTSPINPIHVALLRTGKVLIASGSENDPRQTVYRAAVYDPRAGTFAVSTIPWDLFCNAMSQLPDGRIFITGGNLQYNPTFLGIRTTTIFDPATERFIQVEDMARGRWYPSNATLADGQTMTFGGNTETGGVNTAVEIYRVAAGWSPELPAPFVPALYPWLHLLPNGRIFLSGAKPDSYLFDPATRTWSLVARQRYVPQNREGRKYGSSVLLPLRPEEGYRPRVVVMGGDLPNATNTVEVIDLGAPAPAWRMLTEGMSAPRVEMNAVILPTGRILALGGSRVDNDATTASLGADLFDPKTESWSSAGRASIPRLYHSVALLLPDATVWVAGSNPYQGSWEPRMELYSPAYLFARDAQGRVVPAPRPTIGSAPARVGYGATFQVATPDAADVADVVLIRPGSATHAFNFDQRLVGLRFTAGSGVLTVTSPPNSNIAPPGYYMLFLVNRAGTPSVARFVQLAVDPANRPPEGTIVQPAGDVRIKAGQSVTFAGDAVDPDGTVTRFAWVFPGGSPAASAAPTPGAVTFSRPGTYIVSLTVVDNDGENDPSPPTRTVTVDPAGFTATFTTPPEGALVNGDQTIGLAVGGGGTPPFAFTLKIDGVQKFTQTTSATSTSFVWNTREVADGNHALTLTVVDGTNEVATATRSLRVDNGSAMKVSLTTPRPGDTLSGVAWANVWVENAAGPYSYTLSVGGKTVWSQSSPNTHVTLPWDTRTTPNGPQTLVATVRTSTKSGSTSVAVTVQNADGGGGGGPLAAAFTAPAANATVSGTVTVGMSASGGTPAYTFSLRVDGRLVLTQSAPAATASYAWNTAAETDGSHTLALTVTDGTGATASATRTVTVANGGGGSLGVALTSPKPGATVSGTAWANVWVLQPYGTPPYTYTLGDGLRTVWTQQSSSTHVTLPWDTTQTPDGARTMTATVTDAAGRRGSASLSVTVQNGGPPPPPAALAAGISSPAQGATVAGIVTVGMTAGGGTPGYTYTLRADGTQVFATTSTATSVSTSWDTRTLADGSHTLALTVTDGAGATASATRTVTVANGGGGSLGVALTSPKPGATVSGTAWANVWVLQPYGTPPYTYTLGDGLRTVWTQQSSSTHVTLPWDTTQTPNGSRTMRADVVDAAGQRGSASLTVTVQNP